MSAPMEAPVEAPVESPVDMVDSQSETVDAAMVAPPTAGGDTADAGMFGFGWVDDYTWFQRTLRV